MNDRGEAGIRNVQLAPLGTRLSCLSLERAFCVRASPVVEVLAAGSLEFSSHWRGAVRVGEDVCHLKCLIVYFNDRSNYAEDRARKVREIDSVRRVNVREN